MKTEVQPAIQSVDARDRPGLMPIKPEDRSHRETGASIRLKEVAMYERILVPIDGSVTSTDGLSEAVRLAAASGGQLRLMHAADELTVGFALESTMAYASDWYDLLREDGEAVLAAAREAARTAGIPCETFLSDSYAFPVHRRIASEAERWNADLIVMGTHGRRGVQRWLLGSTAEGVIRYASTPVLLVHGSEPPSEGSVEAAQAEQAQPAVATS